MHKRWKDDDEVIAFDTTWQEGEIVIREVKDLG